MVSTAGSERFSLGNEDTNRNQKILLNFKKIKHEHNALVIKQENFSKTN